MLDNRSGYNSAKLVLAVRRSSLGYVTRLVASSPGRRACAVGEAITGVEVVIAQEFEGGGMKAVTTGLGDHVHYAAGGAAKLSLGIVAHDLELLDEIDVGNHNVGRTADIGVDNSIVIVELGAVLLPMKRTIIESRTR